MIKGALFDKDGTLFDFGTTWEAWSAAFLMRITGQDFDRACSIGAAIGFDMERRKFAKDSVVIAGTPDEIAEALLDFFPEMARSEILALLNEEAQNAPQSEAVPLREFVIELRARNLKIGVATNDSEAPARVHLGSAGVEDAFDFIAGFDSGHGAKPGPGQMLAFAKAVGLDPSHIVMVGDSLHDLHAGRAAGMKTAAVLTGLADHDTLAPFADIVLPDIGGLPEWIDQQN